MAVLVILLLIYLSIFLHELAHWWVARRLGLTPSLLAVGAPPWLFRRTVRGIPLAVGLLPLGGGVVMDDEELDRLPPLQVAWAFLSGSLVSLVLGILGFLLLGFLKGDMSLLGRVFSALFEVNLLAEASYRESFAVMGRIFEKTPILEASLLLFAILNLGTGLFNLLPIPPLDGGAALFYSLRRFSWGKPLYSVIATLGLVLVLGFFVFVLVRDFWR